MKMEVKEIVMEMQTTWKEFKSAMEQNDLEIKKFGEVSAETKTKVDRINARMDEIETKMNRLPIIGQTNAQEFSNQKKEIFLNWCRKGAITPEEQKALSVSDDTTGGYLATDEFVKEIIKNVVEYSPVRSIAKVRTTSNRSVKIPKRTGTFSAQWVAETGTRSETTGLAYGLWEIPNHEMYALVDISQQDLEDSEFDLEAELRAEFAEQFGVAEGTAFVTGNGVGKPEGITMNSDVSYTAGGKASTLESADALIDLFFALKAVYANNGTWGMNRTTLGVVRKLKDGMGQYIWQPSYQSAEAPTILGRPYIDIPDMANIAANAYPVFFGDIRKAYTIVDRVAISIQRDPYTQATSGNVRFIARKRVGGQIVLAEAVRLLKIATA